MTETSVVELRRGAAAAALVLGCLAVMGCAQTGAIDPVVTGADPPTKIAAVV